MSFSLYELKESYLNLRDLLLDSEVSEEDINKALGNLDTEIDSKAENYTYLIKEHEGYINMLKEEIERLKVKIKAYERSNDWLKNNLQETMVETGKRKIETPTVKVWLQKSPVSVNVIDEKLIPSEYKEQVVTEKVLKREILNDLKDGKEIQGVEIKQTEGIRLK